MQLDRRQDFGVRCALPDSGELGVELVPASVVIMDQVPGGRRSAITTVHSPRTPWAPFTSWEQGAWSSPRAG